MTLLKRVYVGQLHLNGEPQKTFVRGKRKELLLDLNGCIFDYLNNNNLPIKNLPPLDDWSRSSENPELWSLQFPDAEWLVTMQSEVIEF